MEILKIYNNNVVSCLNKKGEEIILTGAGLGFKKKVGDQVDLSKVTQKFFLEDDKRKKMNQLVQNVPKEYFGLSNDILKLAQQRFNKKITFSFFLNFTDHIAAAIERTKEGMEIPNLVLMEIKTIWKSEFEFSLEVIDYIEKQTGVRLPIDEAGYIALYFTPENQKDKQNKSIEIVQHVTDIVKIIERCFDINIDRESLSYLRLVTHLRFFIGRVLNDETHNSNVQEGIYELLIKNNPQLIKCSAMICKYTKINLEMEVSRSEIVYLMIHITQILGK